MSEEIKLILTVNSVINNLDDAGLPDGEPEINIFTPGGTLTVGERGKKLSFSEESEEQKTLTSLYLLGDKVVLQKRGDVESDITFREGEESASIYRVGPYSFNMTVKTKRIRCGLTEDGGELSLIYSMNVGGQEKNVRMKISAKRGR